MEDKDLKQLIHDIEIKWGTDKKFKQKLSLILLELYKRTEESKRKPGRQKGFSPVTKSEEKDEL